MGNEISKKYLDRMNCCVNKSEVKRIRIEKEMSCQDVADKTGISKSSVWKLESYNYGIQLCDFIKICKALEVNPLDLLTEDTSTII